MRKKIIAIIGPSGSGKDTTARLLSAMTGYDMIISYTTRPMREGEQEGLEHHFVKECTTPRCQMLAYTEYGGYEYWTTIDQVQDTVIYVIDEVGLKALERFADIGIVKIYVTASKEVRQNRGVTSERMQRDDERKEIPIDNFDFVIRNNGGVDELKDALREISKKIIYT